MNIPALLSFLLLFPILGNSQIDSTKKQALIIAIGNYPFDSDWGTISSGNDIPLIKTALINQGFKEKNIRVIKESEADKKGIVEALHQLINEVSIGDIAFIHYSGHGQQITDDNGDEIDGYDEALIPWDAPAFYENSKSYLGEKHLRDDEFGELIDNLRKKLGKEGQLLVSIDACHSGTGTRGDAKIRGGKEPFIIPGGKNIKSGAEVGSGIREQERVDKNISKEKSPYIVMTATQFNELDYETIDDEGNPVGPLSYAIAKVFNDIDPEDSYLSVFARISAVMAKRVNAQTPSIEGDYQYKIFKGETVRQQPYYNIIEINSLTRIKLNAGNVNGLSNGDKVGIYNSGTQSTDNASPVVTGVVTEAQNFSCYVALDKEFNLKYKNNFWVFIDEYNVKSKRVVIALEDIRDSEVRSKLYTLLKENPLIAINNEYADLIVSEEDQNIVIKQKASGKILIEFQKPISVNELSNFLKSYAQAEFIKKLNLNDENYQVTVEMVPVVPEFDSEGELISDANGNFIIKDTLKVEDLMVNGKIHVGEDDYIMLRINNIGKKDAYFNIIELQPDGIISAVLPQDASHANELFVKAGKSYVPRNFIVAGFAPPYGTEMYKVFATPKPINLTSIITTQNSTTKGSLSDIEKVIWSTYGNTKGEESATIKKKESGSTYDFTFIIEDKI